MMLQSKKFFLFYASEQLKFMFAIKNFFIFVSQTLKIDLIGDFINFFVTVFPSLLIKGVKYNGVYSSLMISLSELAGTLVF